VSKFVPEMHDLGKLCDKESLGGVPTTDGKLVRVHVHGRRPKKGEPVPDLSAFATVDWNTWGVKEPTSDTWAVVRHHGNPAYRDLPDAAVPDLARRRRVFLTVLADHLAATVGRAVVNKYQASENEMAVSVLWQRRRGRAEPMPIRTPAKLEQALNLVDSATNFGAFEARYGNDMRRVPEDKNALRSVTSLLSHLVLTGKFCRLLEKATTLGSDKQGRPCLVMDERRARSTEEAERTWRGRLVRAEIRFHQQPARVGDLNVFERLQQAHAAFAEVHPDHLLFRSANTLWLFLPGAGKEGQPALHELLRPYTDAGFYALCRVQERALRSLGVWMSEEAREEVVEVLAGNQSSTRMPRRRRLEWESVYPADIEASFEPPICDICQMRRARAYRYATATDYLCPLCKEIRDQGIEQRWLEDEPMVAWVRVALDPDALDRVIVRFYSAYVDRLRLGPKTEQNKDEIKASLRMPALLRDFTQNLDTLCRQFADLLQRTGGKRFFPLADDAWVLPVKQGVQVYNILAEYGVLVEEFFPALLEVGADVLPLRLGLSLAPAKYPFYQHWRYLDPPPAPVSVRVVGKEPLEVSLKGLRALLAVELQARGREREARRGRTYLHNLSGIERRSGSAALALVSFLSDLDDSSRKRSIPPMLHNLRGPLTEGWLRMSDVLAWEKLTTFRAGGVK